MRAQGENERPTFLAQVRMDVAGVPSQCGVLLVELESHLLTNDVQKKPSTGGFRSARLGGNKDYILVDEMTTSIAC